ncbi:MAG: host attachment protein [Hyphomicrobiaceae bacterium]
MKPVRTWIVIVDAARARVVEQVGKGKPLKAVDGFSLETELKPTHEIVSDRAGRNFGDFPRHTFDPKTDAHRLEKRRFVEQVVAMLDEQAPADAFDRLVLVAPPKALGDLRSALTPRLAAVVHAELSKDLTKTPDHDLMSHLEDVLM